MDHLDSPVSSNMEESIFYLITLSICICLCVYVFVNLFVFLSGLDCLFAFVLLVSVVVSVFSLGSAVSLNMEGTTESLVFYLHHQATKSELKKDNDF